MTAAVQLWAAGEGKGDGLWRWVWPSVQTVAREPMASEPMASEPMARQPMGPETLGKDTMGSCQAAIGWRSSGAWASIRGRRQAELLRWMPEGLTPDQIAAAMKIEVRTVNGG